MLDAGALTTVQDRGRPGLGAPRRPARRVRWTRRRPRSPTGWSATGRTPRCSRSLLGGLQVRADAGRGSRSPARRAPVRGRRPRRASTARRSGCRPGATLRLGRPRRGRALATSRWRAGSRSSRCSARAPTDTLAWVGPPRVAAGAVLPVGDRGGRRPRARTTSPAAGVRARCASRPGPRADWFADDALDAAVPRRSTSSRPDSDRIGLRLEGARAAAARAGELPSEGHGARRRAGAAERAARGVPGRPSADRRLPGGRRSSTPDDLWQCAQLRPGDGCGSRVAVRSTVPGASGAGLPGARVVLGVRARPARRVSRRSRTGPSPRPRPEPQTQPRPISACTTSMPGDQVRRRSRARVDARPAASSGSSSVSPKRSSWIQSASPETPTPSSRTPPEVSRSASSPRASRATVPAVSVGEPSVLERLSVVKSCSRTLMVTVRPESPCLRSRLATSPAWRVEQPLHQPAVGEVGVVGALDADRLGLPLGYDGPVVVGPGQWYSPVPCALPTSRTSSSTLDRLEVGDGLDAGPAQPLGGGRAHAGDHGHLHRAQQVLLGARGHDDQPVGLVEVAGDLGDELRRADADRRRQPAGRLVRPGRAAPRRRP